MFSTILDDDLESMDALVKLTEASHAEVSSVRYPASCSRRAERSGNAELMRVMRQPG